MANVVMRVRAKGYLSGPLVLTLQVTMHPDMPHFIILLCLMPDNVTHPQGSVAT